MPGPEGNASLQQGAWKSISKGGLVTSTCLEEHRHSTSENSSKRPALSWLRRALLGLRKAPGRVPRWEWRLAEWAPIQALRLRARPILLTSAKHRIASHSVARVDATVVKALEASLPKPRGGAVAGYSRLGQDCKHVNNYVTSSGV